MNVGTWLRDAAGRLASAGRDSSALEARRMAEVVLGLGPAQLVLAAQRPLTAAELNHLERLVEGRLRHVPLQYLLGRAAFRQLELEVGPGVLIPRPETEGLVELALACLRAPAARRAPRILELCVGSGAILAALLSECPAASGVGVELSPAALEFARRNLAAAGVAERAHLLNGDLYEPLPGAGVEPGFDLLVANPPYIPTPALAGLPEDVRRFEPELALDGGAEGIVVIDRIVRGAARWLAPGGGLALEIDESHGGRVRQLLLGAGLVDVRLLDDAAGRPRYATAARGVD